MKYPFEEIQAIDTGEARGWKSFEINGETYLAVANRNAESSVYKWDGASFQHIQTMAGNEVEVCESFVIGNEMFLALANYRDKSKNYLIDSQIYKWNGELFEEFQNIPTKVPALGKFCH